jgi:peptidoglycan/LPS O-acetylase OafA/YrhL
LQDNAANSGTRHVAAVDGLRALAVLSVFVFHLNNRWLPGGFVGVDVFFVISGFVVTGSMIGRPFQGFLASQGYFYARRIVRILPALLVCLIVTAWLYVLFIPRAWLSTDIASNGLFAFLGASNLIQAIGGDGYFSPKAGFDPFTHTWSLGVEEQFYLVFPFLIGLYQRHGDVAVRRRAVIGLIAALCVVSLVASALLSQVAWRWAFYSLPSRFWELGVGMLLCLTQARWQAVLAARPRLATALGLAGLAAVSASFALPASTAFPFPLALLPVLGAAGLIAALVCRRQGALTRLFGAGPVVVVGVISYSLYLWHWPVIVLLRWTVGLALWWQYGLAVALAFALAVLSYRFVEQPLRRSPRLHALPRRWVVLGGLLVLVFSAEGADRMFAAKDHLTLSRTGDAAAWYSETDDRPRAGGCHLVEQAEGLGPGDVFTWTPTGCRPARVAGRLFVAGDSHALAYSRLLQHYALSSGRQVRLYVVVKCPYLGLARPAALDLEKCRGFQAMATDVLGKTLGPADTLFLPSLRLARFKDQWGEVDDAPRGGDAAALRALAEREAAAAAQRLTATGARLVFEAPEPIYKSPPFRCADWFNAANPICADGLTMDRADLERLRELVLQAIGRLIAADPRIEVWDPFPILCPGTRCNAFDGNAPLFFDTDHLSGHGNDVLEPAFTRSMNAGALRP